MNILLKKITHTLLLLLLLTIVTQISAAQTAVAQEAITVLLFDGRVIDDLGAPIPGAQVQFWQTDLDGYYDHPAAPNTDIRDPNFQFYGTATTATDGTFSFRTLRPGLYPGRPGHIHFKVWLDGTARLTSQFYFADENANQPDMLTLDLIEGSDADGAAVMTTSKTIVIDGGNGGSEPITPAQQEGPFYPVVDFLLYDNDLTTLELPTAVTLTQTSSTRPLPIILLALLIGVVAIRQFSKIGR